MRIRNIKIRVVCGIMVALLTCTNSFDICRADEFDNALSVMQQQEAQTQETITNLEKATQYTKNSIEELKKQKESVEDNVDNLKDKSENLQDKIDTYSGKLDDINGQIKATEDAMSVVSSEIIQLNSELDSIKSEMNERQALLKSRIKSVYEKGGSKGMLQLLVESKSFRDVLNRYVYMDAMVSYDRTKLAECQSLKEELEQKIEEVQKKEEELKTYQDELDSKYEEIESLSDEARGMLDSTNESINSEAGKLEDFDNQLAALDKTMKSLASQTAAAQAQLAKQIAQRLAMKREDTSGAYSASSSELEWLAATIQAEAGGESYTGKLAVGSVIMNRVKSSAFPNSIVGVITQNMQFASYRSGKVELIMSKGASSTCVQAAQEVLNGARVGDYLFFMTKYYADYYGISEYTMIGNHAFFYTWTTKNKQENIQEQVTETPEATDNPVTNEQTEQQPVENEQESVQEGTGEGENSGDAAPEGEASEGDNPYE